MSATPSPSKAKFSTERNQAVAVRVEPQTWPRTVEGWCSCPYCTAHREGRLPRVEAPRRRDWLERMGGRGQSASAQMIQEGYRDE